MKLRLILLQHLHMSTAEFIHCMSKLLIFKCSSIIIIYDSFIIFNYKYKCQTI